MQFKIGKKIGGVVAVVTALIMALSATFHLAHATASQHHKAIGQLQAPSSRVHPNDVSAGTWTDDALPVTELSSTCSNWWSLDDNTQTSDGGLGIYVVTKGPQGRALIDSPDSANCAIATWTSNSFTNGKNCSISAFWSYKANATALYSIYTSSSVYSFSANQSTWMGWQSLNNGQAYSDIQYVTVTNENTQTLGAAGMDFKCYYPNYAATYNDCSLLVQALDYQPDGIYDGTQYRYLHVSDKWGYKLGEASISGKTQVVMCSDGPVGDTSYTEQCVDTAGFPDVPTIGKCAINHTPYGQAFQCVELVARYAKVNYPNDTGVAWPDADQDTLTANTTLDNYYTNPPATQAQSGDYLVLTGHNHIGIVQYRNSSGIELYEQNGPAKYNGLAFYSFSNYSDMYILRHK